MPSSTRTAAAGTRSRSRSGGKPPAGQVPEPAAAATEAGQANLQTFAQATGTRKTEFASPEEAKKVPRSFTMPVGLIERMQAVTVGVGHRSYDTDLYGLVPDSLAAFAQEAIEAMCTHYENMFNGGKPFPRAHRLNTGPRPKKD